MMDFYDFCQEVKDSITGYLSPEFEKAKVEIVNNTKANVGTKTGISVCKEGSSIAPCLYLEEPFDSYQAGADIGEIMERMAEMIEHSYTIEIKKMTQEGIDALGDASWDDVKDKVIINAVGATRNNTLLQSVPHRTMGDISATYRISIMQNGEYSASVLIDNKLMEHMGVSETQLFDTAVKNSLEREPATCASIGQVLFDIVGDDDFSIDDNTGLYVLTNKDRFEGAACVFYPGVMDKIQSSFPEGVYVLPSSVHEVLIVSKNLTDKSSLERMVREINACEVSPAEQLSDFVHEYDPKTKELFVDGMKREIKKDTPSQPDMKL